MHEFTTSSGAAKSNFAAGAAPYLAVSLNAGRARTKKSRAGIFDPGTAPRMRDLQLVAVPYFVVC
jgi:hypothetical protein